MKLLYIDCFSGIAGDMTVGALLDLGMPFEYLQNELARLNLDSFKISVNTVEKHKIAAAKFDVDVSADKGHRHLRHILEIIDNSSLDNKVKEIAKNTFHRLAVAEARVHNSTPEKIHFHEVGGIDAIVDIVGAAIGIDYFKPDRIFSSTIMLGSGTAKSSHGVIPIPAPATVEILQGFPTAMTGQPGERVTPTGAAIIASLLEMYHGKDLDAPEFMAKKIGFGAGSRDYEDRPNLLRITLAEGADDGSYDRDRITILETNLDDLKPQTLGFLMDRLFGAGALDVFVVPIMMKKNRPGHLLTVLCKKDLARELCDIIFNETPTAGIRFRSQERYILAREIKKVSTEFGEIRVKILKLKDGIKIQPEYDDCAAAAREAGQALERVMEAVRRKAEIEEGQV